MEPPLPPCSPAISAFLRSTAPGDGYGRCWNRGPCSAGAGSKGGRQQDALLTRGGSKAANEPPASLTVHSSQDQPPLKQELLTSSCYSHRGRYFHCACLASAPDRETHSKGDTACLGTSSKARAGPLPTSFPAPQTRYKRPASGSRPSLAWSTYRCCCVCSTGLNSLEAHAPEQEAAHRTKCKDGKNRWGGKPRRHNWPHRKGITPHQDCLVRTHCQCIPSQPSPQPTLFTLLYHKQKE